MEQVKRRALGMGLEELFNNEQLDLDKFEEKIVSVTPKEEVIELKLSELRPNPYQPRKVFDAEKLQELANSIKEHGVFQPIIVKKSIKGYEIIAGERRYKASQLAGKETIPAIVRDFTDENMMEIALLENLQRENLNSIEEATAYQKLLASLKVTQEELANKLGKSRSHITNMLGLLELPEEVKNLIAEEKITMSHARVLSKMKDKDEIINLANKIVDENLNVRAIEQASQNPTVEKKHKLKTKVKKESEYKYIEESISEKLGTKVKINKRELLDCIDRATLLVKEGDKKPIIMNITDGNMELKINSFIGSMNEDIDIAKEGKDILIGFNPKFFIDALRVIDEEEVSLYMVNPKAPCFIKDDEGKFIYLILPVNFNAATN